MIEMHDIVVVGGGPVGCRSAQLLSRDFDVHVLEEHPVSGTPVQCTGLVSNAFLDMCGVKPEVLNRFSGASFEFPNGKDLFVGSRKGAVLIDRGDLDRKLAEAAVDAGAKLHFSRRYVGHRLSDGTVRTETSEGKIDSILIIGADGHSSKVAESLGGNGPKEYVRGLQYDIRYRMQDQDTIRVFVGNDVAPGFFAWMIPFGEFTRVGLCSDWDRGLPSDHLRRFMRRRQLDGCEVVARNSGKIPLGGRRTTYGDNTLLIGDAAGQVKPLSGGGLYPAFVAMNSLDSTVRKAMDEGNFTSKALSEYERGWKRDIGKTLDSAYSMRGYYHRLTDDELNLVYEKMSRDKYRKLFEDADIDDPGRVVKKAMRDIPLMLSVLPLALKVRFRR